MPFPAYGALGHTFVASRLLQTILLLVTIALTSHCISELSHDSTEVPGRLIGYLVISCVGVIYTAFTSILYIDSALPLHLAAICDGCIFFAYIALSILFGEGVATLSCTSSDIQVPVSGEREVTIPAFLGEGSYNGKVGVIVVSRIMRGKRDHWEGPHDTLTPTTTSPGSTPTGTGEVGIQTVDYTTLRSIEFRDWVRGSPKGCQFMKGTWGVGIVVVVLFAVSMGCLVGIWWMLRKQRKQIERENKESKLEHAED